MKKIIVQQIRPLDRPDVLAYMVDVDGDGTKCSFEWLVSRSRGQLKPITKGFFQFFRDDLAATTKIARLVAAFDRDPSMVFPIDLADLNENLLDPLFKDR